MTTTEKIKEKLLDLRAKCSDIDDIEFIDDILFEMSKEGFEAKTITNKEQKKCECGKKTTFIRVESKKKEWETLQGSARIYEICFDCGKHDNNIVQILS